MKCTKCNDTGWYRPPHQRGTVHDYKCDACCTHDKGYWMLKEMYGENNGKWCCMAGCGKIWSKLDEEKKGAVRS